VSAAPTTDDAPAADATDDALARGFAGATLTTLSHRDHVRLGWIYLAREPLAHAAARFTDDLQRLAAALGAPGKYHETLTWAYLLWIHACMGAGPRDADSAAFLAAHPELLEPGGLRRFYRAETLAAPEARRVFLLPDLPERDARAHRPI
jgi:hypothetical protein